MKYSNKPASYLWSILVLYFISSSCEYNPPGVKVVNNDLTLSDLKRSSHVLLHENYIILSLTDASEALQSKSSLLFYRRPNFDLYRNVPFSGGLVKFRNDTIFYRSDSEHWGKEGNNFNNIPKGVTTISHFEPKGSSSTWKNVIVDFNFKNDSLEIKTRASNNLFATRKLAFPIAERTVEANFKMKDSLILDISDIGFSYENHKIWTKTNPYKGVIRFDYYVFCNKELEDQFYDSLFQSIREKL